MKRPALVVHYKNESVNGDVRAEVSVVDAEGKVKHSGRVTLDNPANCKAFAAVAEKRSGVQGGAPQILKAMSQRLADLQAAYSPITFKELAARYPTLSPPVIEGLLRVGETGNIIAATKVGK